MGEAKFADKRCLLLGFNFSTTTSFILEFGQEYVRFWSNGLQVVKSTADAWVTATAYEIGDYVLESSIIYYCVTDHTSAALFATDLTAGNWVAQDIVEVPTPYAEADLRGLQFCPINDLIYITHPLHYVRKLTRVADDDWTFEQVIWEYPPTLDENIEDITLTQWYGRLRSRFFRIFTSGLSDPCG
jgi:hypothetical protein